MQLEHITQWLAPALLESMKHHPEHRLQPLYVGILPTRIVGVVEGVHNAQPLDGFSILADGFLIVVVVGVVVNEVDEKLSHLISRVLLHNDENHQENCVSFQPWFHGPVQVKAPEDSMKGEENGFDEIVEAKGILNELNILPSVVLLLKYGDVYLPTVQTGCQFDLDVGELQLIVEVYLVDA